MKTIRLEKTFTVKVWQNIELPDDATVARVAELSDKLELAACMDLSNIGQEIPFGESHDCTEEKMYFL